MKSIEEMRAEIEEFCDNYNSHKGYSCADCPLEHAEGHLCYSPGANIERNYALVFGRSVTPTIKDSGERREFESGAVRDMAAGKGDMVSLPNAAILRLSKHYEAGATKYGRWNYLKGLPVSSFMDSALRHLFKYLDGWDDEDHLAAAAFNVLGAMEMEAKHKELIDIPNREGKECFDYEGK